MKTFVLALACSLVPLATVSAETVIDFEELDGFDVTLPMGKGRYFNGYAEAANSNGFVSKNASFLTNEYGPGFSYSSVNDSTSPGFQNQFAAYPGGGSAGDGSAAIGTNYGLVATGSSTTADGTPTNGATMNFDNLVQLASMDVANATYAALYMKDGTFTDFVGNIVSDPLAKFGDGDFFRLTITGFNDTDASGEMTGQLDFDLANYGSTGTDDDFLLAGWQTIDLSGFSQTRSLRFASTSSQISDFGEFGIFSDVPAYAAIDNLQFVTAIPEPSLAGWLALAGGCMVLRRRSRR